MPYLINRHSNQNNRLKASLFPLIFLLFFFLFLIPSSIQAATYSVSKTADTNDGSCDADCSLREAVAAANSNSGTDTVSFSIPSGDSNYNSTDDTWTITLGSALTISASQNIIIDGSTQAGNGTFPTYGGKIKLLTTANVGTIVGSSTSDLTIKRITFQNSSSTTQTIIGGSAAGLDIQNSYFTRSLVANSQYAISLTTTSGNVTFSNNKMETYQRDFITSNANSSSIITIENNLLVSPTSIGFNITGYNITFKSNELTGNFDQGILSTCNGGTCVIDSNIMNTSSTGFIAISAVGSGTYSIINNSVSSNHQYGIRIASAATVENNTLQGSSVANPSGKIRVVIGDSSKLVIIQNNTITTTNAVPILVQSTGTRARIHNNVITSTGTNTPINLSGGTENSALVTAIDFGDTDTGPNDLMNYPVIDKVAVNGSNMSVQVDLDFKSTEAPYTLEFFDNDTLNSSGHGGGQYYIGSVTTSQIGHDILLTVPITGRTPTSAARITSTATNTNGSTSEFSAIPTDTTLYSQLASKGVNLDNNPSGTSNGYLRLTGTAWSVYSIQNVQYSVNGGGYHNATPQDGFFNSESENFYLDFLETDNSYRSDGYTVKVRAQDKSDAYTTPVLYFRPFSLVSPDNRAYTENSHPIFSFHINKGRFNDLKENLDTFQVVVNKDNTGWKVYADTIPVAYESVRDSADNMAKGNGTSLNGIYDSKKIWVKYSNDNAHLEVYTKSVDTNGDPHDLDLGNGGTKLTAGSYQWKVIAYDKGGHSQETELRTLLVSTHQSLSSSTTVFPLSLLSPFSISTQYPQGWKTEQKVFTATPTFYGIGNVGSEVTLILLPPGCQENDTSCMYKYTSIVNEESRFGINILKGDLQYGKKYTMMMSIAKDDNYNELPTMTLSVVGKTAKQPNPSQLSVQDVTSKKLLLPSPEPSPTVPVEQKTVKPPQEKRKCFLFICF